MATKTSINTNYNKNNDIRRHTDILVRSLGSLCKRNDLIAGYVYHLNNQIIQMFNNIIDYRLFRRL